jgi:hypothetical protein
MKSRALLAAALLAGFVLGLVSVHPVAWAVQMLGVTACKSGNACIGGSNSGSGPGVIGISTAGKFGVRGQAANGTGVSGVSTSNTGVSGTSVSGTGVVADSTRGTGLSAMTSGASGNAIYAKDASNAGAYAVNAVSYNGTAVQGATSGNSDAVAGVSATNFSSDSNATAIYAFTNGANYFTAYGLTMAFGGNITTQGEIYTQGSCMSGCNRRLVQSYETKAALPTIEDAGEAQLHGGAASVLLDPAFANVIDARRGYLVLITPEGDTRGLYVARRTATGFSVRESMDGRSTVAFAYRIVAHPFGSREPRLPFVAGSKNRGVIRPRD